MQYIQANWPIKRNIHAVSTTRNGGVSEHAYASLNLSYSVGDDPNKVRKNRDILKETLALPVMPIWLKQTHSNRVICLDKFESFRLDTAPLADASYTTKNNIVCVVSNADCLPVLVAERDGKQIGAIHAGWRGLASGIIENTLSHFDFPKKDILVWLGPAISQRAFEVGEEVREAFIQVSPIHENAFLPKTSGKYLADLYLITKQKLHQLGIDNIYGGNYCTYENKDQFFSYRRDKATGRMASLIWKGS